MTPTRLALVDGVDELELWTLNPLRKDLIVTKLTVGSPGVREVVDDRPDAHGTDDDTQYHGASAVSLELSVYDNPQALLTQLKPWLRLARRPYLALADDEWDGERRIRLRYDQKDAPQPWQGLGRWVDVQIQWKAPDGVWVASDAVEVTVAATGGTTTGITFPIGFPVTFAATTGVGQTVHANPGDEAADQRVRLYGPCAGPRWTCDTTGQSIIFSEDLVIPAGEYVELDTREQTAFYLSDPGADRLSQLDFEATSWWQVPPGESRLRYHPTSQVNAGCAAVMAYQPNYAP